MTLHPRLKHVALLCVLATALPTTLADASPNALHTIPLSEVLGTAPIPALHKRLQTLPADVALGTAAISAHDKRAIPTAPARQRRRGRYRKRGQQPLTCDNTGTAAGGAPNTITSTITHTATAKAASGGATRHGDSVKTVFVTHTQVITEGGKQGPVMEIVYPPTDPTGYPSVGPGKVKPQEGDWGSKQTSQMINSIISDAPTTFASNTAAANGTVVGGVVPPVPTGAVSGASSGGWNTAVTSNTAAGTAVGGWQTLSHTTKSKETGWDSYGGSKASTGTGNCGTAACMTTTTEAPGYHPAPTTTTAASGATSVVSGANSAASGATSCVPAAGVTCATTSGTSSTSSTIVATGLLTNSGASVTTGSTISWRQ